MSWIQFYLEDRKKCCKFKGNLSKQEKIKFSGSSVLLRPLNFFICIDDLRLALDSSNVNMYTYDTSIYYYLFPESTMLLMKTCIL